MTRIEAILADVRAGLRDGEVAQRHGVTRQRVGQLRRQVGLPPNRRPRNPPPEPSPATWTAAHLAYLIAHADAPVRDMAAALGRTPGAVRAMRRRLIAEGRMAPSRVPMRDAELALLVDPTLTDAEIAHRTDRTAPVIAHARRVRGIVGRGKQPAARPWTAADIETLITLADHPADAVAARLGRTVTAVANKRSALIREGRIDRQVTGRRPNRQQ
jgi:hypothetical protein